MTGIATQDGPPVVAEACFRGSRSPAGGRCLRVRDAEATCGFENPPHPGPRNLGDAFRPPARRLDAGEVRCQT